MYPLNLEEVIAAAAENNTVLEINGSPSRLDLDPEFVHKAKKAGVLLAVNYGCTRYRTIRTPSIWVKCRPSRMVDKSRSHQHVYFRSVAREV